MVTVTSIKSGDWSATDTWDTGTVPVNGDAVIIVEGHNVRFDDAQLSFTNGLLSMVINGVLHFKSRGDKSLKMGGNITGTGMFIVGEVMNVPTTHYYDDENEPLIEFITHPEYPHIYGTGFVWEGVSEFDAYGHVEYENQRIAHISEDGDLIEGYTEVDTIEELATTPKSFMRMMDAYDFEGLYIHTSTGASPMDFEDFTYIREIPRPEVGTETRCTLMFNATGTINVPTIRMYGWYPEKEYTQLDADAELNATEIVLKEDLGLQAGDVIAIGSGTEVSSSLESNKGIYTVQSYNSETKTVIITSGLQTARLKDDYIAYFSRPIKISRTSGTASLITNKNITPIIIGLRTTIQIIYPPLEGTNPYFEYHQSENGIVKHCSIKETYFGSSLKNYTFEDCISIGYYFETNSIKGNINRCILMNVQSTIASVSNPKISNSITQNTGYLCNFSSNPIFKNNIFKNLGWGINFSTKPIFINCTFSGMYGFTKTFIENEVIMIDCEFLDGGYDLISSILGKYYNCKFNRAISPIIISQNKNMESFDHNQIPGNYKAWCKGGKIETVEDKLKFICESNDYPVFRDYPTKIATNQTKKYQVVCNKDFDEGIVKIELIDTANDPLIDSAAEPVKQVTMPDEKDKNHKLTIVHKAASSKDYILRISAQAPSGNVLVDTRYLERMV